MRGINQVLAAIVMVTLAGCSGGDGKPVRTAEAAGTRVTLATPSGKLVSGANELTVTFMDATGQPAAIGSPAVRFSMPAMGAMPAMRTDARLESAGTPGKYKGSVELSMKGTWQTTITFQDAGNTHRSSFNVQAE